MGVFRAIKKGVGSGFRVKRWLGADRIKGSTETVKVLAKTLFESEPKEDLHDLNFEQCLKHYHMTEADLELRMKQAKKWITFCLAASVFAFAYMFYQLHSNELIATFVCFMIGALTLVYAFREHFNLFQMRQRRLGCRFSEWFSSIFSRGK
jgi:intracellular multiplication protein IcmV